MLIRDMAPTGARELDLMQRIIDNAWRQNQIPYIRACLRHTVLLKAREAAIKLLPEATEETLAPHIEAETFILGEDIQHRLLRYETTLLRNRNAMHKELDRMQKLRGANSPAKFFSLEKCRPYHMYLELVDIASQLVEARRELHEKTETIGDSTRSAPPVLRNFRPKTHLRIVHPLTPATHESLETADEWGLLTEIEQSLFEQQMAA